METTKNYSTGVTSASYPRLAICSALTPPEIEYYEKLKEAGINTVSICLHMSGCYHHYKYATIQTNLARKAEMTTHAFMLTDLYQPTEDVMAFTKRFDQLGYGANSKITILPFGGQYIKNREERIADMINLLSNYHNRENIDLAFYKKDLDNKLFNLDKLPKMINLTIINVDAQGSGVTTAGTWVYYDEYENDEKGEPTQHKTFAYDYYGYYTDNSGYQLSLIDTDYVVQPGDTWYSISRRHGIPLEDLLLLNRALAEDPIYAGQVIRIA